MTCPAGVSSSGTECADRMVAGPPSATGTKCSAGPLSANRDGQIRDCRGKDVQGRDYQGRHGLSRDSLGKDGQGRDYQGSHGLSRDLKYIIKKSALVGFSPHTREGEVKILTSGERTEVGSDLKLRDKSLWFPDDINFVQ